MERDQAEQKAVEKMMDNYDLWEAHDREQERQLEKLPVCEICGKPIQDEDCYLINDEFVCPDCLDREFKKKTEDYIEH